MKAGKIAAPPPLKLCPWVARGQGKSKAYLTRWQCARCGEIREAHTKPLKCQRNTDVNAS